MKNITKAILNNKHNMAQMRPNSLDRVTSVSEEHMMNTETYNNSELRDIPIASPYGISSIPLDNILAQIVSNGGRHIAIGVIDPNRPKAPIGGIVIYDKGGNKIILDGNDIHIKHTGGSSISMSGSDITFSDGRDSISLSSIIAHMSTLP